MKKQWITVSSILIASGLVTAFFIIPNVGRGKDEVLVRKWKEREVIEVTDSSNVAETSTPEMKQPERLVEADSTTHTKEKPRVVKKQIREITKTETLKAHPVKFSRAMHFEVQELELSDTILEVVDLVDPDTLKNIAVTINEMNMSIRRNEF